MTNLPENLICLLLQGTEPLLFFKTKYKALDFLSIERKWTFEIPWVLPKATRGRGKDSLIHSWNSKIYRNCDGNFDLEDYVCFGIKIFRSVCIFILMHISVSFLKSPCICQELQHWKHDYYWWDKIDTILCLTVKISTYLELPSPVDCNKMRCTLKRWPRIWRIWKLHNMKNMQWSWKV